MLTRTRSGGIAVTMRRNGKLLVVHRGPTTTLHEVSLPTLNASRLVPSPDGEEVYAFDARGRHLRTVSARTGLLLWQFTWGPNGLASITDVNGDVTTVEREASGAVRALVAQDGQRTELTLDAQGRVTRITDSEGRFVEAAYRSDSDGLLQEWKDENGHATAFEWDANGNLLTHTNARNAKKRFAKTSVGVDFTSAEQRLTQYLQQRGASGGTSQVTAYADATVSSRRSVFSQREFESREGVVTEVVMQPGLGARFGRAIEVPGDVSISTPEGLRANISSRRTSVNAPGNLFDVTEEVEETRINGKLWTTRYDGVAKTSRATSPLGRVATATLDAKLRPLTVDVPGLLPMTLAYDSRGRLLSLTQGVRSQSFVYGPRGFLETSTNALNETTRFTTDATGRVTQVTRADTSAIGLSQDNAGNLSSVTPPGATPHAYGYTSANELVSYTPPAVAGSGPESRAVDLDGLTTSLTHADATGSMVTREPSGRVERVTTPWWTNVFTYFPTTGQVQSLMRGGQRLQWRYDGFLMKEEKALGIAAATSTWTYDSDFRVTSHGVNGAPLAIQYDDDSALLGVGPVSLTRVPATGQLASVGVGSVVTSIAFNGYGETSSRSVPSLYSEALTYDAAGRIVLVNEVVEGVASQFVYTTDSQGRLMSVSVNGGPVTTWTYSPHGNRLTENGVPSTYDTQDRLLSRGVTTYTWDAMGSRLSMTSGGQTTQYVHEGRALKSVTLTDRTVVGYEYDGRQRRVARTRNGVVTARWVYDGQYRVVAEVDASGAVTSRFIYASEGHSPDAMVRGDVMYAYVKNHLGTVKLVVNAATGAVVQRIESDAWGNVLSDSNPGFQPFIFAGGVFDTDTRLTHFGFRDYDSSSGSWLSPELLLQSPMYVRRMVQSGMSVPTYAYAANNPLRYIDPTGLWTQVVVTMQRSFGIDLGNHIAVRVDNAGDGQAVLFDPGGSYNPPDGPRGSSDAFEGSDSLLPPYVRFHRRAGDQVMVLNFDTTPEEEAAIAKNFGYGTDEGPYGVQGGFCAITTSNNLKGIGPFRDLKPSYSPAAVSNQLFPIAKSWTLHLYK